MASTSVSGCATPAPRRALEAIVGPLGATVLLVLLCGLAPVALALAPRAGEPVVVLTFSPDAPLPASVLANDVPVLAASPGGHAVVLATSTPGLVRNLYERGATLVLAAEPLGACLPVQPPATPRFSQGPS